MSSKNGKTKAGRLMPEDYPSLLAAVKDRVRAAQYAALKAVNKQLVALYWDIGHLIVSRQGRCPSWGCHRRTTGR